MEIASVIYYILASSVIILSLFVWIYNVHIKAIRAFEMSIENKAELMKMSENKDKKLDDLARDVNQLNVLLAEQGGILKAINDSLNRPK
jgi:wobble nucleotide-excising tRNase